MLAKRLPPPVPKPSHIEVTMTPQEAENLQDLSKFVQASMAPQRMKLTMQQLSLTLARL